MKNEMVLYILAVSLFCSQFSMAQDITPNSGFEMWTLVTVPTQYLIPDSWDNLNPQTNFIGILTCIQTTDAHSGTLAAKLVTKIVTIGPVTDTANGIITTGHLITTPPYGVIGGIPTHERPDSIFGWIKYQPTPGDSCQIEFDLRTAAGDTVGKALYQTGETLNTYTRFSAPIVYFSSATPDTSLWLISSSNGFNAYPNSTLYVDDIGIAENTGIAQISLSNFITLAPDPADNFLRVKNEKLISGDLTLFDETGRKMKQACIKNPLEEIDVSDLPEGIYLVRLTDAKNDCSASGKIVVQH